MKFQAKKIDVDLELTTLSGEEVLLTPNKVMSTESTYEIMKAWTKMEADTEEGVEKIILLSKELAFIYPKDAKWFRDNFDFATLGSILEYVAKTIGNIQKKDMS